MRKKPSILIQCSRCRVYNFYYPDEDKEHDLYCQAPDCGILLRRVKRTKSSKFGEKEMTHNP
jgi:hypothetical protein